ncbi:MAG: DUF1540 domain-containing protein [Clostridia bacterium]|nr:DUF1540 domain-containing protein [Clostridia bacterium]
MDNINKSIACTVTSCKYHSDSENYCTLNNINVGTHEANPTKSECTDCNSFECKD